MAIDAVVGGIELSLQEPRIVSVLEGTAVDGLEISLPGEEFASLLGPEFLRLGDRFVVELFVFVQACIVSLASRSEREEALTTQMRFARMFCSSVNSSLIVFTRNEALKLKVGAYLGTSSWVDLELSA